MLRTAVPPAHLQYQLVAQAAKKKCLKAAESSEVGLGYFPGTAVNVERKKNPTMLQM